MSEKHRGLGRITVAGVNRPFQVDSIRQARAFCEQMGIELDDYWTKVTALHTSGVLVNEEIGITLLYSALYAGAQKERIPIDFTYDDVLDWVEDADPEGEDARELAKPLQLFYELLVKKAEALEAEIKKLGDSKKA